MHRNEHRHEHCDDGGRGRKVERREQRLQALSTAEIARRAGIRSGTWLMSGPVGGPVAGLPRQRDPQAPAVRRPATVRVPRQREAPPES
jgi:hypothetical protein